MGQDLSQQTEEVMKECHKDGYKDKDIIPIAQKESAVKLDEEHRLSLHELKSTIIQNEGEIGCVYVYEISRIGRIAEVNYSIRNFLQQHKVQLVILKPYIRLFDDNFQIIETANMTFAIFNALAENEGYLRKERFMRGVRKAQSEGKAGTGKVPFGYYIEPKTHYIRVDEEKAAIVRKLYDMYANQDYSTVMLARYFHETGEIPSRVTVGSMCRRIGKMLSNPAYIGGFPKSSKCNGKLVNNMYPPIMTVELYNKVQAKKRANFNGPKKATKYVYYCKGILLDEITKQRFAPRVISGSYFFIWDIYTERRQMSIPINLLDSIVWHVTKEYSINNLPVTTKEVVSNAKNTRNALLKKAETAKKRITDNKEKILRINERIVSGRLKESVGDAMIDQTDSEISQLEQIFIETMFEVRHWDEVIERYSSGLNPVSISSVTDDEERIKLIRKCITSIEASKEIGLPNGTTDITINFENGTFLMYRINSYSRTCHDRLTGEYVKFDYMNRIDYYQYRRKKTK
jgi:DNA invertase Pin-like site-specific DNA recombinase